jgi:hypothetical protein
MSKININNVRVPLLLTFMGDLNQFPGFQQSATGCN